MPDSSLRQFDKKLAEQCWFKLYNSKRIEFQFAPKLVSENNSSLWMEVPQWSYEPLRIHKGSQGRRVNMEWEYLASDRKFNCSKVGLELKKLKSYFFEFEIKNKRIYPTVQVRYTKTIPQNTQFRIRDVNITFGPEIIENQGIHPLYTKVAVLLELATNLATKTSDPKIINKNLQKPALTWY